MVAMSTSIDLAKSGDSLEANRIYLDRAQRSLNRMRGLVSSATEATSLEAALAVEEMERVDLSGVVMDRLTIYQELHPSRRFTLSLRPGLSVDGNEGDALPADMARIFEAFVSTQKTKDNLGLGLFVAQSIALNHGGEISAEDLPEGSGARFVVRLPTARTEGRDAESEASLLAPVDRAKHAEDQPPQ